MSGSLTISDNALRRQLATLLQDGLQTEWQQRTSTSEAVNAVLADLSRLDHDDLVGKLRIAGFTLQAYCDADEGIEQACTTCMYYELHRQFCVLPELMLPVGPEWSCRLWRI